jgi:hypothetical protein
MKTSKFWNYMAGMSEHCQPLYNWRHKLKDELDFEAFKERFLIPIDEFAERIICPDVCPMNCDRNVVRQYNGDKYEAVCQEWSNKFFVVEEIDTLIYRVRPSRLNQAIANALGIHYDQMKMRGTENSWRIGEYPGTGSVFVTLEYSQFRIMELLIDCNRLTRNGYLLLGTNKNILNQKCEEMLFECGATFVAMNEILDLNREAEFYLLKPIEISEAKPLNKEANNIFRKCGDVWEVRFQGGEKFMLNSADTGAKHLHFMLDNQNTSTSVIEIVRRNSDVYCEYNEYELLNTNGYTVSDFPITGNCDIADEKAVRDYWLKSQSLLTEMENAKASNNNVAFSQLREEMEKIKHGIEEAISPIGQKKKFNDPMKNITDAFRSSVNFAIDKIGIHDSQLGNHFRKAIRYGQTPGYFPSEPISWEL